MTRQCPTKTPTADPTCRGLEPLVDALKRWFNGRYMRRRAYALELVDLSNARGAV